MVPITGMLCMMRMLRTVPFAGMSRRMRFPTGLVALSAGMLCGTDALRGGMLRGDVTLRGAGTQLNCGGRLRVDVGAILDIHVDRLPSRGSLLLAEGCLVAHHLALPRTWCRCMDDMNKGSRAHGYPEHGAVSPQAAQLTSGW